MGLCGNLATAHYVFLQEHYLWPGFEGCVALLIVRVCIVPGKIPLPTLLKVVRNMAVAFNMFTPFVEHLCFTRKDPETRDISFLGILVEPLQIPVHIG